MDCNVKSEKNSQTKKTQQILEKKQTNVTQESQASGSMRHNSYLEDIICPFIVQPQT